MMEKQRQQEALNLMRQPVIGEFIAMIREEIVEDWANTVDSNKRDALWHDLQALTRLADKIAQDAMAAELDSSEEDE